MDRKISGFRGVVFLLVIVGLAGCGGGTSPEGGAPGASQDSPAEGTPTTGTLGAPGVKSGDSAVADAPEAGKEGEAAPEKPAEEEAGKEGEATPEKPAEKEALEKLADEMRQDLARRRAQADALYRKGLEYYEAFLYEEAPRLFHKAVVVDPPHSEAREMVETVGAALGEDRYKMRRVLANLTQERRNQIQGVIYQIRHTLREAWRWENEGSTTRPEESSPDPYQQEKAFASQVDELTKARERYQRAEELVRSLPYQVDVAREEERAREGRRRVTKKIEEREERLQWVKRTIIKQETEERHQRQSQELEQRIRKLVAQCERLFAEGKYAEAEELALIALKLDPFSPEADYWKWRARNAKHAKERAWFLETYPLERVDFLLDVDEAHIPYSRRIVYPPNWDEIVEREQKAALISGEPKPEWQREIEAKLTRKVSFEFVETPFANAIAFLRDLAGCNIIVGPTGVEGGGPQISLNVQDMDLQSALEWVLRLADLSLAMRNGAIYIDKKENLAKAGELFEVRIYDVHDITMAVRDFVGPELTLNLAAGVGTDTGGGALFGLPQTGQEVTPERLAEFIQQNIAKDQWAIEGASIQQRAGRLIVSQKPEIHQLISKFLADFRATQKILVTVEARFLQLREAFFEEIGVEWHGIDQGSAGIVNWLRDPGLKGDFGDTTGTPGSTSLNYPRVAPVPPNTMNMPWPGLRTPAWRSYEDSTVSLIGAMHNSIINYATSDPNTISSMGGQRITTGGFNAQVNFMDGVQAQAFLRAVNVRESQSTLFAPRLTVRNGQRAYLFVARQQSYVRDYEISGDTFDPVVSQVLDGVVLDIRPIVSYDRKYITLDLRPTVATVVDIRRVPVSGLLRDDDGDIIMPFAAEIQLPTLEIQKVRTSCTIPDGGILYIGGLYRNIKFAAENGVPFVSDLPVVGRFFRWNADETMKMNLAMLITARILLFDEAERERDRPAEPE